MNNNSPRLVYFEIKNIDGQRIYTLSQNEIALIDVTIYIPDSMLDSRIKNDDFSIYWTVNNDPIQYDNIPIQEIIRTNKHNLSIQFKLDTHLTESINLNLSLHAKYSTITPQEQIKQFSFFETVIERKNTVNSNEEDIKKKQSTSKPVFRNDDENWIIPEEEIMKKINFKTIKDKYKCNKEN